MTMTYYLSNEIVNLHNGRLEKKRFISNDENEPMRHNPTVISVNGWDKMIYQ